MQTSSRVTKVTFEDDKTMEYLYDEEGNVTQVTENASSTTPKVTQFSYYGDNRLHQVTYVRNGGNQVFTYAYDAGGRPLTLTYPASTGRNFDELLRVIDSLQLTASYRVATPANWRDGDDVIIGSSVTDDEATELFPQGWTELKPYLRVLPQPHR